MNGPPEKSSRRPHRARTGDPLSDREIQILALVAAGEPTPAIRTRLGIAENTIKSHLTSVYKKTGSRNRVQATRYYLDHYAPPSHPGRDDGRASAANTPNTTRNADTVTGPSLIQRQIQEIEARIDQLVPAAGELERLQHARDALRSIEPD